MQTPNFLSTVSEMLQDGTKDKGPELAEIFNQYLSQSISGNEVNVKIEKLFEETPPNPKPDELTSANSDTLHTKQINNNNNSQVFPNNFPFSHPRKKSRQWSQEEDQRLADAMNSKGSDSWSQIAKMVGNGRTPAQCSQRWNRVLNPKISKLNWSKEEEEKLINLVSSLGTKAWTKISSKMGNRSDVQCRFRYNFLLKKADYNVEQISPIALPMDMLSKNPVEAINLYEQGD